jgi:hypothetical protein
MRQACATYRRSRKVSIDVPSLVGVVVVSGAAAPMSHGREVASETCR